MAALSNKCLFVRRQNGFLEYCQFDYHGTFLPTSEIIMLATRLHLQLGVFSGYGHIVTVLHRYAQTPAVFYLCFWIHSSLYYVGDHHVWNIGTYRKRPDVAFVRVYWSAWNICRGGLRLWPMSGRRKHGVS